MSFKSWALKDTFVSQQIHEQGDQLFYFWRHCPSSQKPICTAPPIEERGQVSYFLGGLFVLPWESEVCDSTHENRRNPPLCMPTQKANRDAKCPDHFQVISQSPTVPAQTLVLQQCQGAVDAIKNWFPCPLMSLPLWNLTLLTHAVHCSVSACESILSLSSDSARHLHLHIAYACSVEQQGDTLEASFNSIRHAFTLKRGCKCLARLMPWWKNIERAKLWTENIFFINSRKKIILKCKQFFQKQAQK